MPRDLYKQLTSDASLDTSVMLQALHLSDKTPAAVQRSRSASPSGKFPLSAALAGDKSFPAHGTGGHQTGPPPPSITRPSDLAVL